MSKNWTKIFATGKPYQAELIKGLLEENNIESIVVNKQDSAYLFGELELYVDAEDIIQAKRIIEKHSELWKNLLPEVDFLVIDSKESECSPFLY